MTHVPFGEWKRDAAEPVAKTRHAGRAILKLAISVGLLLVVVDRIGWSDILAQIPGLQPSLIAIPLGLILTGSFIRTANWTTLLRASGSLISVRHALYSYWAGTFIGAVIPTGFGIDVARVMFLNRQNRVPIQTAASTGLALNVVGLLTLSGLAVVGAMTLWLRGESGPPVVSIIVVGLTSLAVGTSVILRPSRLPGFRSTRDALTNANRRPLRQVGQFISSLELFDGRLRLLLSTFGMALATQLLSILTAYSVALAFGIRVPFLLFLAFLPVVAVARYLPISVGGFGGEQGVFVLLFEKGGGVPAAEAFVVSFGFSGIAALFTLICGAGYVATTWKSISYWLQNRRDPTGR